MLLIPADDAVVVGAGLTDDDDMMSVFSAAVTPPAALRLSPPPINTGKLQPMPVLFVCPVFASISVIHSVASLVPLYFCVAMSFSCVCISSGPLSPEQLAAAADVQEPTVLRLPHKETLPSLLEIPLPENSIPQEQPQQQQPVQAAKTGTTLTKYQRPSVSSSYMGS